MGVCIFVAQTQGLCVASFRRIPNEVDNASYLILLHFGCGVVQRGG